MIKYIAKLTSNIIEPTQIPDENAGQRDIIDKGTYIANVRMANAASASLFISIFSVGLAVVALTVTGMEFFQSKADGRVEKSLEYTSLFLQPEAIRNAEKVGEVIREFSKTDRDSNSIKDFFVEKNSYSDLNLLMTRIEFISTCVKLGICDSSVVKGFMKEEETFIEYMCPFIRNRNNEIGNCDYMSNTFAVFDLKCQPCS